LARVAVLLTLGAPRMAAACRDDALVREFQDSGDAFRAVTVLRQHELERRGTPEGFECARMILGAYLRHGELDLADDWIARMGRHYAPLLAPGAPLRLRVELAYLVGNSAEVKRRADESGRPGLEGLALLSRAADLPLSIDAREAAACAAPACAELRSILDQRADIPHKSPGLALALGVVPGLGQVYAGRALAGLGSFLLNGFLIGTSVLSGGIGLAFYTGGVYAGYEAATRFNEREAERLRARIRAVPVELELTRLAL
jgi:TM2 domain-containing membrane protein YozV